jgi:hypothetical protein
MKTLLWFLIITHSDSMVVVPMNDLAACHRAAIAISANSFGGGMTGRYGYCLSSDGEMTKPR